MPIGDSTASWAPVVDLRKEGIPSFELPVPPSNGARVGATEASTPKALKVPKNIIAPSSVKNLVAIEAYTPKVHSVSAKGAAPNSTKNLTAKKLASLVKQTVGKPKTKPPSVQSSKCTKPKTVIKCPGSVGMKS